MKRVTATELKQNFGQYLELARKEKIMITKNGKVVAIMAPPDQGDDFVPVKSVTELFGIIPADADIDIDKARMERLMKKCGY